MLKDSYKCTGMSISLMHLFHEYDARVVLPYSGSCEVSEWVLTQGDTRKGCGTIWFINIDTSCIPGERLGSLHRLLVGKLGAPIHILAPQLVHYL